MDDIPSSLSHYTTALDQQARARAPTTTASATARRAAPHAAAVARTSARTHALHCVSLFLSERLSALLHATTPPGERNLQPVIKSTAASAAAAARRLRLLPPRYALLRRRAIPSS